MAHENLAGVFAPVLTPFDKTLKPDGPLFVKFCSWILSQGSGLAVFGTNSEANSLSVAEKLELLGLLIENELPPERLMPGTGACALSDAVTLCEAAAKAKTAAVLMLPPFYYKQVPEDGLFAFYAETIERVGAAAFKVCLYHIPQVSGIAITMPLIERLIKRYPDTVVGIKDSGGDFANTRAMLDAFPGFRVFSGSERFLLDTMRHNGAGCISAMANIHPGAIVNLYETRAGADAPAKQTALNAMRAAYDTAAMMPGLKRTVAEYGKAPGFRIMRPPLMALSDPDWARLETTLNDLGLKMPNLDKILA
ncbi:dihydrodipicolinate synthase family protein [Taklimakanibacter lacteus]|uniref:dihydrodipicolinate synthase family protein n=1 Tax=Taklimakanibacter lacteus TaxID=2268456 RepID=UPI000E673E0D